MDKRKARATLATACATHFLHDGFSDILYVLFPVWAREFSLSFAQVGLLRSAYSGAMASFQIPAGFLADRWGEPRLLAAGTALVALGFITLGAAGSFAVLLLLVLASGLGSGVQHPLSSSLVSRAYEVGPRRVALGTYNFSGDLGKVTVPALVAVATAWVGWRSATIGYGCVGLLGALAILLVLTRLDARSPSVSPRPTAVASGSARWGIRDRRGFQALTAIYIVDNSTRTAFLTYLPFLLLAKGSAIETIGFALALIFAGGAVGKFVCGALAERLGIIRTVILTEGATSLGILALLALPLRASLAILPIVGVALNGTSSVLYGTVADLVVPERRSRAYGLFYTLGISANAVAPAAYGLASDWVGVKPTLAVIGLVVLLAIPLCRLLRLPLTGEPAHASPHLADG